MEKKSTEILREIEAEIASLKQQIRDLEELTARYRAVSEEEEAAAKEEPAPAVPAEDSPVEGPADFTDMEIGVTELPETASLPEDTAETFPEEDLPGTEAEPVEMDLPEGLDLPEPVAAPEPALVPEPAPVRTPATGPRPGTEDLPWRLDKPGLPVKNIRSGISLYDRALFIGTLFREDYALYDKTISELNALSTLDEAVDYLAETFPDWNLRSDIVYNFMMAIRKKLG